MDFNRTSSPRVAGCLLLLQQQCVALLRHLSQLSAHLEKLLLRLGSAAVRLQQLPPPVRLRRLLHDVHLLVPAQAVAGYSGACENTA